MSPTPHFGVLGPLTVESDGGMVTPGSRSQRIVLAALVAHHGSVVTSDRLVDALWLDDPPATAERTLQSYVSRLRSALGADIISSVNGGYQLNTVAEDTIDAHIFESLVQRAADAAAPEADRLLTEALALWRGPAYGEFSDLEFARLEALRLEELRLLAVERRASARLALGHHQELIGPLEALVERHPLREELWLVLISALQRSGRQAEALRAADRYRAALAELGLEPSATLRALEDNVFEPDDVDQTELPSHNLPHPATSFVGRDADRTAVLDLLEEARLVTLTGPGGVGKTRLAIEIGHLLGDRLPDPVRLVRLSDLEDGAAVAHTFARGLDLSFLGNADDAVVQALRSRRMLLIVDNCEHVLAAAVPLIQRIVSHCPGVTVLATSRERLGVGGEHTWPVPPLAVSTRTDRSDDASVRLFLDRARAVRPGFEADAEVQAVAAICRTLDGLPLAIEMAAAWVRTMSPVEIAGRLDERLLKVDQRGTEARHATLWETLDWSYASLTEEEQVLFDRASVFSGGFTLDAVHAICCGDAIPESQLIEILGGLIDRSMILLEEKATGSRYRVLSVLQRFGAEHLDERGEHEQIRARHADYYLSIAENLAQLFRGPEEAVAEDALYADLGNLRAVHRWALEQGNIDVLARLSAALQSYGQDHTGTEILDWAEQSVQEYPEADHPLWPVLYASAAARAAFHNQMDTARTYADTSIRLAGPGNPIARNGFFMASEVALYEGDIEQTLELATTAAELCRQAGDDYDLAGPLITLTLAHSYIGNHEEAARFAGTHRAHAESLGTPTLLAWTDYLSGEILLDRDPELALRHLDRAIEQADAVHNHMLGGVARVSTSSLRSRTGDPAAAVPAFVDVIDYWRRLGDSTHQWTTLRNAVVLLVRMGHDEPASVLHGASIASAPPTFGDEATRIDDAVQTAASRLGPSQFEAARSRGMAMAEDQAVGYALSTLRGLLDTM